MPPVTASGDRLNPSRSKSTTFGRLEIAAKSRSMLPTNMEAFAEERLQ